MLNQGKQKGFNFFSKIILPISVGFTVIIIIGGYLFFNFEENRIKNGEYLKLKAIANLKADQIINWKNERISDAIHFSNSPLYSKTLNNYFTKRELSIESEMIKRNKMIKELRGFQSVFIVSTDFKPCFVFDSLNINDDTVLKTYVDSTFTNGIIYFSDIYKYGGENRISITSPIVYNNKCIAVLVFLIDPKTYFFPLIQLWPLPSKSSEVILIKKQNGEINILNTLKFQRNAKSVIESVKQGGKSCIIKDSLLKEGMIEGNDYRNIGILGDFRSVKGTPWFILTKVDKEEVLHELNFRSIVLMIFIAVAILIMGLILALNYQVKRRAIEKNLLETTKRLKDIVEFLPDAILAIDIEGKVIVWNRAMSELTGIPETEMIGKDNFAYAIPFFGKRHPILVDLVLKEYPEFNVNYTELKKEGETLIAESNICEINGKNLHLYGKATKLYNQNGEIYGAMELIRNITEIKERELLLQEKEIIFQSLMEHSPIYVFFKDHNINAIHLSRNFEQMFGIPLEKVIGKNMFDLFPSDLAKSMVEDDKRILFEGNLVQVDEELNGRYYTTIKFPINQKDRKPMLAGFTIDITDRKLAEKELLLALDRAERSEKLKDAFLQNMSHEIRTPMNAIIGFSELLGNNGLDNDKINNYISIIISSSNQLLSIVDDILTVSRIQTGQEIVNESKTNVNGLIDNLFEIFKLKANNKNIELVKCKLPNDGLAFVKTDSTKLNQILTNLISNAFKFTAHGKIEFGCEIKNDFLEFSVKDTGIGICDDKQSIIFDRFTQADLAISKKYGGTGLGLSICKAYVELLGGSIWVESTPGLGSAFFFTVKYERVDKSIEHNKIKIDLISKDKRVILIAEDEKFNYQLIKEILDIENYLLLWAKNGLEAIEFFKTNEAINLVLMDIKMPELDGLSAMLEIRKLNPEIPIIAQTAYAMDVDKEQFLQSGFTDYISKPISKNQLLQIITKYI